MNHLQSDNRDNDKSQSPWGEAGPPVESPQPQVRPSGGEPAFNVPGALVVIALACIAIHFLRTQVFGPMTNVSIILNYALIPERFTVGFVLTDLTLWLSLVSHTLLHGDWLHLAFNLIWLVAFGAPVAYRLGTFRTLAFWVITALGAAALHMALYWGDPVPLIGASGAVSGFLGAAARFGFRRNRAARTGFTQPLLPPMLALRQRGVVPFLALWMVMNYASGAGWFGAPSNIAWEAHIGGLITGFFLIGLVDPGPAARAVT
ncbi:MAG: rhomboid family intramembrane serine protease [Pseudomonadota bacterium]